MRLSNSQMYARMLASDASCNGRFFTGVLTTGIYCLPSCKARKPRPENVKFFPTCEAARSAGLRPCKKCHPDDFARGADPVLEDIESLVTELRQNPAAFPDVRAIVRRSGFGATRLFELFRHHYHGTPADVLLHARLETAKRLLLNVTPGASNETIATISYDVGFESVSVFHDRFRQFNGLTPGAFRELATTNRFTIQLPAGYPLAYLRRALSRDTQSVTERLEGNTYTTAARLPSGPAQVELRLTPARIEVVVTPLHDGSGAASALLPLPDTVDGALTRNAHALVVGLLGLHQDAAAFARLTRKLGLTRLTAGRAELRISQTPSVFDGLLWSIIGQQINFAFACVLKRRLVERTGIPLGNGLFLPPTPEAVAALDPAELLPLQFSRQKAEYVIATARLVAERQLDLDALPAMSAIRAERTLLAIRGLGPWSVNYLMMRSLGFADCVPLGDTGVTSGLKSLFKLEERPDVDATRRLMAVFSPYRSLATAHLWQFLQPIPS